MEKKMLLREYYISIFVVIVIMTFLFMTAINVSYAKDINISIKGDVFEYGGEAKYDISDSAKAKVTTESNTVGKLSIGGNLQDIGSNEYYVSSGNINFSYNPKESALNGTEDQWHLTEDKTKTVNGISLDGNILCGTLIVQTSLDGETWIEDAVITDAFSEKSDLSKSFYSTKTMHQLNGCHYKIIVVYKMQKKVEDKKIVFMNVDNYEYKRIAEVYSFQVIDKETVDNGSASPADSPRYEYSDKVNTGRDKGYDIEKSTKVDNGDPHFSWVLGTFTINGYTREAKDKNGGDKIFLKTIGDNITLWFTLKQDINSLDGKSNLSISEDTNGYDKNFEIKETNFKHGVLIVKYTDEQGNKHDPVIYTDFLVANSKMGADTRIKLYEEGDYEVALDYEIKSLSGPLSAITSYTNYKMYFKFSIRNGNTMVFPKELVTESELADGAITPKGFLIDMAKSKYLTIDVVRTSVKANSDGTLSTDVRNNTVGKDNSTYSNEGIYTITAKNQYSEGVPTTKTIYVGSSKYLMALAKSGNSVEELNEKIRQGALIADDGTLIGLFEKTEPEVIETFNNTESTNKKDLTKNSGKEKIVQKSNEEIVSPSSNAEEDAHKFPSSVLFVIGGLLVVIAVAILVFRKKAKMNKEDHAE